MQQEYPQLQIASLLHNGHKYNQTRYLLRKRLCRVNCSLNIITKILSLSNQHLYGHELCIEETYFPIFTSNGPWEIIFTHLGVL